MAKTNPAPEPPEAPPPLCPNCYQQLGVGELYCDLTVEHYRMIFIMKLLAGWLPHDKRTNDDPAVIAAEYLKTLGLQPTKQLTLFTDK